MTESSDTQWISIKEPRIDVEGWRAALARVEFKFPIPVKMWIQQDDNPWGYDARLMLRMSMEVPDRDDGKPTTVHSAYKLYPDECPTAGEKIRLIRERAKALIEHEFDEHFRVDGELVFDPHGLKRIDTRDFARFNEQRNS